MADCRANRVYVCLSIVRLASRHVAEHERRTMTTTIRGQSTVSDESTFRSLIVLDPTSTCEHLRRLISMAFIVRPSAMSSRNERTQDMNTNGNVYRHDNNQRTFQHRCAITRCCHTCRHCRVVFIIVIHRTSSNHSARMCRSSSTN
jgi:hypothetical protein